MITENGRNCTEAITETRPSAPPARRHLTATRAAGPTPVDAAGVILGGIDVVPKLYGPVCDVV
jgi:hypothetical protein